MKTSQTIPAHSISLILWIMDSSDSDREQDRRLELVRPIVRSLPPQMKPEFEVWCDDTLSSRPGLSGEGLTLHFANDADMIAFRMRWL